MDELTHARLHEQTYGQERHEQIKQEGSLEEEEGNVEERMRSRRAAFGGGRGECGEKDKEFTMGQ